MLGELAFRRVLGTALGDVPERSDLLRQLGSQPCDYEGGSSDSDQVVLLGVVDLLCSAPGLAKVVQAANESSPVSGDGSVALTGYSDGRGRVARGAIVADQTKWRPSLETPKSQTLAFHRL